MVMKLDPVMVLLDRLLLDRFQNFFSLHFNHFVKKISRHVCSQTFMLHQQSSSLSTVACLHFLPLSATSQVLLPWLVVGLSKGNLANEFSIRLVWPIILRQCHCPHSRVTGSNCCWWMTCQNSTYLSMNWSTKSSNSAEAEHISLST